MHLTNDFLDTIEFTLIAVIKLFDNVSVTKDCLFLAEIFLILYICKDPGLFSGLFNTINLFC